METREDIKRGIDLKNRLGGGEAVKNFQSILIHWDSGKLNAVSYLFIGLVFLFNLFLILPFFNLDVSSSFSSSALILVANFLSSLGLIDHQQFFSLIVVTSLSVAPICFYLFVRTMVLRHELAALLATLFFIVPTPLFKNGLPLIDAVLLGDGAHAVAFSFLPLVLIFVQGFISTGFFKSGTVAAILMALVAIISPFAFFNLLIIFTILAISDGFLGNLRTKLIRSASLVLFSLALSFFWYYPSLFNQIILLNQVVFAFNKLVSILPLAIPGIPIIGTVAFLVFDRREKLRPFFIAIALFLIYFALYSLSKTIGITGLFTYYRYVSELSFAISFGLALFLSLVIEVFIRNYILKTRSSFLRTGYLVLGMILVGGLAVTSLISVKIVHNQIQSTPIKYQNTAGIGNIKRVFDFQNFSSILASIISFSTLVILLSLLLKSNLPANNSNFKLKKIS